MRQLPAPEISPPSALGAEGSAAPPASTNLAAALASQPFSAWGEREVLASAANSISEATAVDRTASSYGVPSAGHSDVSVTAGHQEVHPSGTPAIVDMSLRLGCSAIL